MKKIIVIPIITLLVALSLIGFDWYSKYNNNKTYSDIATKYVTVNTLDVTSSSGTVKPLYANLTIDFDSLSQLNPDVIGWIKFDFAESYGLPNYPILYSGDDYYLRRDIEDNVSTPGSIYLEGTNNPNLKDAYNIIYGHHMKNGTMFGSLSKFKDSEFLINNQYFTIYTKDKCYRYAIFSTFTVDKDDDIFTTGYNLNSDNYQTLVASLRNKADYDIDIDVSSMDKVVLLSTCSSVSTDRYVVAAVLVNEFDNE